MLTNKAEWLVRGHPPIILMQYPRVWTCAMWWDHIISGPCNKVLPPLPPVNIRYRPVHTLNHCGLVTPFGVRVLSKSQVMVWCPINCTMPLTESSREVFGYCQPCVCVHQSNACHDNSSPVQARITEFGNKKGWGGGGGWGVGDWLWTSRSNLTSSSKLTSF